MHHYYHIAVFNYDYVLASTSEIYSNVMSFMFLYINYCPLLPLKELLLAFSKACLRVTNSCFCLFRKSLFLFLFLKDGCTDMEFWLLLFFSSIF